MRRDTAGAFFARWAFSQYPRAGRGRGFPLELFQFEHVADVGGRLYLPILYIIQEAEKSDAVIADILVKMETWRNNADQGRDAR